MQIDGRHLTIKQGETLIIEQEVKNEYREPAVLIGAIAKFVLKNRQGTVTSKDCTIDENIVSVTLTSEETAVLVGDYGYEFWLRLMAGENSCMMEGVISVTRSIQPGIPAPEENP